MQTHATALLGAAGVAAFYALVHLFDLRGPSAAKTADPKLVEYDPATADIVVPMVAVEAEQVTDSVVALEEPGEARTDAGRRAGGSRKSPGRRAKAPKVAKVVELAPLEEPETPWPVVQEPDVTEEPAVEQFAEMDDEEFVFSDNGEPSQSHIAPLFEPEPFARMQRRAFGRRGRL